MAGRRLDWWPTLLVDQWVTSIVDQKLTRVLNQFAPSIPSR